MYSGFVESFGTCDYKAGGTCVSTEVCPSKGSCYVECKPDNQCKYAEWVLFKSGNMLQFDVSFYR